VPIGVLLRDAHIPFTFGRKGVPSKVSRPSSEMY
jgi:hypothetical protein